MDNPKIYSDGVNNSVADSPLRVQNKILGALKNLGGQEVTTTGGTVEDVAAMPVLIVAENAERKFFTIQNLSTSKVFIQYGASPTMTSYGAYSFAAILKPASGYLEADGGVLSLQGFTGEVWAVCSSGDSTQLAVTEFA